MAEHTIVAAGQFTVTLTHPLYNDGTPTTIDGFRLEGQMVQAQQAMDSSKIVMLANGNTLTIINNNGAGSLTFNVVKTGNAGDMVKIANKLKAAGDSRGGVIRITQQINGKTEGQTYKACTVRSCPPLNLQGNDAADYQVVWNYGEYADDADEEE